MSIIRGFIRSLPADQGGFLVLVNREWTPILRSVVNLLNGRNGFVRTVTADYTCSLDDQVVLANSGSALTVTLPEAAVSSMRISVKNINGAAAVTVAAAAGDTVEGAATYALAAVNDGVDVVSDGVNAWHVVAQVT